MKHLRVAVFLFIPLLLAACNAGPATSMNDGPEAAKLAQEIGAIRSVNADTEGNVVFIRIELRKDRIGVGILPRLVHFRHLQEVELEGDGLTDEDLRQLAPIKTLRSLNIGDARSFSGTGLSHLRYLPHLEKLCLYRIPITDDGAQALPELRHVKELNLVGSLFGAKGCEAISRMTRLAGLYTCGPEFDEEAARHLTKLSNLEHLNLRDTRLSDENLGAIVGLPRLKVLHFDGAKVTFSGLMKLASSDSLEEIHYRQVHVTKEQWKLLREANPNIEWEPS